jgi:hypothetical protein
VRPEPLNDCNVRFNIDRAVRNDRRFSAHHNLYFVTDSRAATNRNFDKQYVQPRLVYARRGILNPASRSNFGAAPSQDFVLPSR